MAAIMFFLPILGFAALGLAGTALIAGMLREMLPLVQSRNADERMVVAQCHYVEAPAGMMLTPMAAAPSYPSAASGGAAMPKGERRLANPSAQAYRPVGSVPALRLGAMQPRAFVA